MATLPGISESSASSPEFLKSTHAKLLRGVTVGTWGAITAGTAMGKITASGKYAPVRRTQLAGTEAIGQTVLSVDDVTMFAVGDTVYVNNAAWDDEFDAGAITAIGTDTITVTNALDAEYVADDFVYVADGSQTALGLLCDSVDTTSADELANIAIACHADSSKCYLGGTSIAIDTKAKEDVQYHILFD